MRHRDIKTRSLISAHDQGQGCAETRWRNISLVLLPRCVCLSPSFSRELIHARFSVTPSFRHAWLFKTWARRDPNGPSVGRTIPIGSIAKLISYTRLSPSSHSNTVSVHADTLFELMAEALADEDQNRPKEEPVESFIQPGGAAFSSLPFASTFPLPPIGLRPCDLLAVHIGLISPPLQPSHERGSAGWLEKLATHPHPLCRCNASMERALITERVCSCSQTASLFI